ncbi:hypothetical protein ACHQM5_004488 [Ranunculus cassubicifolius]
MTLVLCENDISHNNEFDRDFLMAVPEEARVEVDMDDEEEKRDSVIQSLEAEMDPSKDFWFEDIWDCFGSPTSDIYDWIDTEMTYMTSLSRGDDRGNWHAYIAENELVGMTDFQDHDSKISKEIVDYLQICYVDGKVNSSSWQERYDSVMNN